MCIYKANIGLNALVALQWLALIDTSFTVNVCLAIVLMQYGPMRRTVYRIRLLEQYFKVSKS